MGTVKVAFVGDTHGQIRDAQFAVDFANREGADLIIQLGDFGYDFSTDFMKQWVLANMPVYFLRGNHDSTGWIRSRNGNRLTVDPKSDGGPVEVADNVHYLPDGARLKIGDSRVAVLGGAVSIDRHMRVDGVSWWHDETTSMQAVADLVNVNVFAHMQTAPESVDVMLCHDCPTGPKQLDAHLDGYKSDPASDGNRKLLRHAFDHLKPSQVWHGHFHYRYKEECDGATFHGLGMSGPDACKIGFL